MRPQLFSHVDHAIDKYTDPESRYASITTMPKDNCMSTVIFVSKLAAEVSDVMEVEYGNILGDMASITKDIDNVVNEVDDLVK